MKQRTLISSKKTVILKFFFPILIIVLGGLSLILWTDPGKDSGIIYTRDTLATLRLMLSTLTFMLFVIWVVFFREIKRAETTEDSIVLSNYFKTFNFPLELIKKQEVKNLLFFKTLGLEFNEKTDFGRRSLVILNRKGKELFSN